MSFEERVASALGGLGLYRLGRGNPLDAELAAYRAGLSLIQAQAGAVQADCFVQTASEQRLSDWERLLGLPLRQGVEPEVRRRLILLRRAVRGDDYTPGGMARCLEAAGLRAEIQEDYNERRLVVTGQEFLGSFDSIHDVMEQAGRMLPAHLVWEFNVGSMTWHKFELAYENWLAFDAVDQTWEQFDMSLV